MRTQLLERREYGVEQVVEFLERLQIGVLGLDGIGAAEQETGFRSTDHGEVVMAVANGDEVYDLPRNNSPKNTLSKGEKKKCKSCRHFPCPESKEPMRVACGNHERRKKK